MTPKTEAPNSFGVYIGMLPDVGGSIIDRVAYGHAAQSARDKASPFLNLLE